MNKLAFTAFILLIGFSGAKAEALSDAEFEVLVASIYNDGSQSYLKIAKSGHPEAMSVLRALEAMPSGTYQSTFENFSKEYGYEIDAPPKARMRIDKDAVNTALAAAGDEAAWQRIVDEYNQAYETDFQIDRRKSALKKMEMVNDDRAKRFASNLLTQNDQAIEGFALSLHGAASLMRMVNDPELNALLYDHPTIDNQSGYIEGIKEWWIENGKRYGATDNELAAIAGSQSLADYMEERTKGGPKTEYAIADKISNPQAAAPELPKAEAPNITAETSPAAQEPKDFPWKWVILGATGLIFISLALFKSRKR